MFGGTELVGVSNTKYFGILRRFPGIIGAYGGCVRSTLNHERNPARFVHCDFTAMGEKEFPGSGRRLSGGYAVTASDHVASNTSTWHPKCRSVQ
ncbi:MAG: hypothetical protein RLY31_380 [Bacteroidota bacterium]